MALVRFTTQWADARGFKAAVRIFVNSDSAAHYANFVGATIPLITALTNAAFVGSPGSIGEEGTPGVYGVASDYQSITLKAVMTFLTTDGNLHRIRIPAPKRSIFLADGTTVDPANTDVAAFVTGLITGTAGPTNAVSRGLANFSSFVGGQLLKAPTRRKISIFTLNPTETGPDE